MFSLVIVNTGDAPAKITDLRYGVSVISREDVFPQEPNYATPFRHPFMINIGLGETWEIRQLLTGRVISDTENSSVREGQMRLYIYGHVQYTDGGAQRGLKNTAFCRVLEHPQKPFSSIEVGRLIRHEDPDYEYED